MEPTHLNEAMRRLRAPRQLLGDELAEFHRAATGALLPTSQQPDGRFLDPATHRATGIWTAAVEWTCRQLDPLAAHFASQSQAAQPSIDPASEQWIFDLAAEHEANRSSLYGPVVFDSTGLVDFARAIAAHLAGQSQATRTVPEGVQKALQTIARWELPASGRAWDAGTPMSYGAAFGSNGERDYMRQVALDALSLLAPTAQEVTQQAAPEDLRECVRNAVTEALAGLYYCGRVWSAWGVGTMSQDDFSPADEDDDIIENVTDAAINAMVLANVTQQAAKAETAEQAYASNERKIMKLVLKTGNDNTARELTNDEALEMLIAQYGEHSGRIVLDQLVTGQAKTASVGVNRGIFATSAGTTI